MNKSEFLQRIESRKEQHLEIMDEWVENYLLDEASILSQDDNTSLQVYENSVPPEVSIQMLANYLENNNLTITRLFDNEMSASGKSFIVSWG